LQDLLRSGLAAGEWASTGPPIPPIETSGTAYTIVEEKTTEGEVLIDDDTLSSGEVAEIVHSPDAPLERMAGFSAGNLDPKILASRLIAADRLRPDHSPLAAHLLETEEKVATFTATDSMRKMASAKENRELRPNTPARSTPVKEKETMGWKLERSPRAKRGSSSGYTLNKDSQTKWVKERKI